MVSALPATVAALRALAAVFAYPEARARAEALGGVEALFGNDKVLLDCALRAIGEPCEMLVSIADCARAVAVLEAAGDFAPSRPDWAVAAVEMQARTRAEARLAAQCYWAGDCIRAGDSISHTARELWRAFTAAGVGDAA